MPAKEWLKGVFTPEQAKAVVHLTLHPESLDVVAGRMGKSPAECERLLDDLIKSGFAERRLVEGEPKYAAMSMNPGWLDMVLISRYGDAEFLQKTWGFVFKTDFHKTADRRDAFAEDIHDPYPSCGNRACGGR